MDFFEYIFRVDCFDKVSPTDNENESVSELNQLLRVDDLPYYITNFQKETVKEISQDHPFAGREITVIRIVEYPRVIMRENEVLHSQAIVPTLTFLQKPVLKNANSEFLDALEDYRKGDFGDCLTKCGSAFESVMKVICAEKGWAFKEADTANTLIKTVVSNSSLDSYFETPLMVVATLRNRLSSSHGGGAIMRNVSPHLARFAINATASNILLLAEEVGMQ